jgi:hypothetical protein
MFPFWIDPTCLSLCEVTASIGALLAIVNAMLGRPA